jgi:hypothetical protein
MASDIRHKLKDEGSERSLANKANKSDGGCCRLKLLPPGHYVQYKDLADAATAEAGRRCAVYWADKSDERTLEQKNAGEKGRWWHGAASGVKVVHGQVHLKVTYDAQYGEASGEDVVNVRNGQVVWL